MTAEDIMPWHTELAEAVAAARKEFNEKKEGDLFVQISYFNALCIPLGILIANESDPARVASLTFDPDKAVLNIECFQHHRYLGIRGKKQHQSLTIVSQLGTPLFIQTNTQIVGAKDFARIVIDLFEAPPTVLRPQFLAGV